MCYGVTAIGQGRPLALSQPGQLIRPIGVTASNDQGAHQWMLG
jgi:hypothetical protein